MTKRNYRSDLDFVASGFRACWQNAKDLLTASQRLMDGGLPAPALSLSVLALEELGKLIAIDGLLYATQDDYKSERFDKSLTRHKPKLTDIAVLRHLLRSLARADPRYGKEEQFGDALRYAFRDLKGAENAVLREMKDRSLLGLDRLKQRGFYAEIAGKEARFITPSGAISPSLATAVHHLAWRAVTTLDFVLKGGNLERYLDRARSVRAALTEKQHQEFERQARELIARMFGSTDAEASAASN
jgi:AbiV family abortive infection protein